LEPLGEGSPIAKFLARNQDGGMHHLCYEVDDIRAASDALKAAGARVLGDGEPKTGAHGKPVLFLHPKDFFRHFGRAGAGLKNACHHRSGDLFPDLVARAVHGAAVGRAQPARGEEIAPAPIRAPPAIPNLRRKLVWTTLVSVVVFCGVLRHLCRAAGHVG